LGYDRFNRIIFASHALYILETEQNHRIAITNRGSLWCWENGA